jgi:hypothetical protein
MHNAVEMSSGVMIYIASFIKTGSGTRKLMARGYIGSQTAWIFYKPTSILIFYIPIIYWNNNNIKPRSQASYRGLRKVTCLNFLARTKERCQKPSVSSPKFELSSFRIRIQTVTAIPDCSVHTSVNWGY